MKFGLDDLRRRIFPLAQQHCIASQPLPNPQAPKQNNRRSLRCFPPRSWGGVANSLLAACVAIAVAAIAEPVLAAERLKLRFGPLEQTVEVSDLEHFAETGELRNALRFFSPLLSPSVQQILAQRLAVDPSVADTFLKQLFEQAAGEQLLKQLSLALPESSIEQLEAALYLALQQADGLSVLGFLRAYPGDTLTIDATAAVGAIVQLNASNLQSQLLSPILERELKVAVSELSVPATLDPRKAGEYKVRERSLSLYDRDRQREILVDLFYTANPHGPTVILSHGFAADRRFLNYLAHHLASHGFSVAAIEHPGSNINTLAELSLDLDPSDLLPAAEFIERPKDISFLLDELERRKRRGGYVSRKFNTEEAAIIGHSLGGYTALALAGAELDLKDLRAFCQNRIPLGRSPADWLQCAAAELPYSKLSLRDERVARAIALNPLVGKLFGEKGLERVAVPLFVLSGSEDSITPPLDHQLRPFSQLPGEKYLAVVIGGTHMSATDLGDRNSAIAQSTLVKELMGQDAEPVRQLIQGVSLAFIRQLTPQAELYQPFLTPSYAQSLSTTSIPIRLTEKLPSTLGTWLQVLHAGERKIASQSPPERQETTPWQAKVADRCLFETKPRMPWIKPCQGQLHYIFTSLMSNYPT